MCYNIFTLYTFLVFGGFTMKAKVAFLIASGVVLTFASLLIYQAGYLKGYKTGYTNQAEVSARKTEKQG